MTHNYGNLIKPLKIQHYAGRSGTYQHSRGEGRTESAGRVLATQCGPEPRPPVAGERGDPESIPVLGW